MLFYGGLIIGGYFAYIALKGDTPDKDELTYGEDDNITYECKENYEEETFDYFMSLPIEYQEKYFSENLDLKRYKDDLAYGLTADRYLNAKHAREIARIMNKKFTDYNKTY